MNADRSKTSGRTDDKHFRRGAADEPKRRAHQQGVGLDDRNQEQPLDHQRARDERNSTKQTDESRR